jgi:hypothetical protein
LDHDVVDGYAALDGGGTEEAEELAAEVVQVLEVLDLAVRRAWAG